MRLLLVFPPWCLTFSSYKGVAKKASSFPPLNLCYVASIARAAGWEVRILDAEVNDLSTEEILAGIAAFKPDLVGMTATTPFFHVVCELASELKRRGPVPIIVGGVHASIMREAAFRPEFDYLFVGECEASLPEFLARFAAGRPMDGVPGVMHRSDGRVVYGGDPPRLADLDSPPMPARDLLDRDRYRIGTLGGERVYTSMFMSRGCPFQCVFCASDLYGNKVRYRSIPAIIRELRHVVDELGVKHIYFLDDTLTLNRKFILEMCDAVEDAGLRFTFEGGSRANLWDEELVRRMRDRGLIRISFGLETVDPEVRRLIKKEVSMESHLEANRLNKRLGIETINSVMLGLPGETRESMERTVDFLCEAKDIDHATYGIATPYPGTELYRMAKEGRHGLKLVDEDFSHFQRYGIGVMEVNGMAPAELVELQKKGLRRIYSRWWRIYPMLRRHGLRALLTPLADWARDIVLRLHRR